MESAIQLDHHDAQHPPATPTQHKYGTRTRQNSIMRPSVRLRQVPEVATPQPRKIRPAGPAKPLTVLDERATMPKFPPDSVVLHPDDATSKVFLAIGRALMAIDNRAVTIKDLAEMTVKTGIGSQNVSAASQAITTYIRLHMRRCDEEQDQPLLLRHVLSGTPSDDELMPALSSRAGGAHCGPALAENRLTNFRKGTIVWYLSKAAGAPCPFARAGLRVCDYTENGKTGPQPLPKDPRERRRERDRARRAAQCGDKRKRLSRACASTGTDVESDSDVERPPPKVKLTLRLRPSVALSTGSPVSGEYCMHAEDAPFAIAQFSESSSDESDDDSMAVDTSEDEDEEEESDDESCDAVDDAAMPSALAPSSADYDTHAFGLTPPELPADSTLRRSPSVPYSVASAPPDSEEEDEDFHISMTGRRRSSSGDFGLSDEDSEWPFDFDADDDADDDTSDTAWGESPDTLSPPPLPVEDPVVKIEQTDVRGMLEAWDDLDKRVGDAKVAEMVARATTEAFHAEPVKTEPDPFSLPWEEYNHASPGWDADIDDEDVDIKQEDSDMRDFSPEIAPHQRCSTSPIIGFSSLSLQSPVQDRAFVFGDRRPSLLTWQDVELKGPDSVHPREFDDEEWPQPCSPRTSEGHGLNASPSLASSCTSSSLGNLYQTGWADSTSSLSSSTSSQVMTPSDSSSSPAIVPSTVNNLFASVKALAKELTSTPTPSVGPTLAGTEKLAPTTVLDIPGKLTNKRHSSSSIQTIVPLSSVATPWEEDTVALALVNEDLELAHAPFAKMDLRLTPSPIVSYSDPLETPLSPAEQEMFHSLCSFTEEPVGEPKDPLPTSDPVLVAPENDGHVHGAETDESVPDRPLRRSTRLAGTRTSARPTPRGASAKKRASK